MVLNQKFKTMPVTYSKPQMKKPFVKLSTLQKKNATPLPASIPIKWGWNNSSDPRKRSSPTSITASPNSYPNRSGASVRTMMSGWKEPWVQLKDARKRGNTNHECSLTNHNLVSLLKFTVGTWHVCRKHPHTIHRCIYVCTQFGSRASGYIGVHLDDWRCTTISQESHGRVSTSEFLCVVWGHKTKRFFDAFLGFKTRKKNKWRDCLLYNMSKTNILINNKIKC